MKIAINAQLRPGGAHGGVEQVLLGLVNSLGKLNDGDEEYIIVVHPDHEDWLSPYLGSNEVIVPARRNWEEAARNRIVKVVPDFMLAVPRIGWRYIQRARTVPRPEALLESGGFFESLGVNVIHYPYQSSMVRCAIPGIYNPHDLQHLHYPEFFTKEVFDNREAVYRACCRYSQAVVAESQWCKNDIVQHYGIEPEKVYVIPFAALTELYEPVADETVKQVQQKFSLSLPFALYPAQTWPHKNHIRLLEAIALIREQNHLKVNLVCTGRQNDFWPNIARRICELNLENQVQFLGFIGATDLRALYRLAHSVVFPSLFEPGNFPIYEAFLEGVPLACSNAAALPEQAGNAALLFDPTSVDDIARAIYRMAIDEKLRTALRQRGVERVRLFTWEKTARAYRALYRKLAGKTLSNEDSSLLSANWMVASSPLS